MEFLNYTFDIQSCEFFLGSTWHHSKIMTYSLKRKKIKMYTSEGSNADSVHAAETNLQYHIQLEPLENKPVKMSHPVMRLLIAISRLL